MNRLKEKLNKIIFKEPHKEPVIMQIENSTETYKKLVGGDILILHFENENCIICKEKSLIKDEEPNIEHIKCGIINGNICIVGLNKDAKKRFITLEEDVISLTDKEIKKYIGELKKMDIKNKSNVYNSNNIYASSINKVEKVTKEYLARKAKIKRKEVEEEY